MSQVPLLRRKLNLVDLWILACFQFNSADEIPFFICSTTLFERDDPAEEGQPEIQRRADVVSRIGEESEQVTTMVGQLVTSAMSTTDLQGQPAVFFGFGDLSVRIPGEFRVRFSLGQACVVSTTF